MALYFRKTSTDGYDTWLVDNREGKSIDAPYDVCRVIASPTNNCQAFSIAYIYGILRMNVDTKELLRMASGLSGKKIMYFDVNMGSMKKRVLDEIKPYVKEVKCMNYKSTSGSRMSLCMAILDLEKLKE